MARRFRQLVPQLRQRELGIRRRRPDAAADRQHQRSADQGERAQISLAARPPAGRSSFAERSWTLEHDPEKWKPVFRKDHAQSKSKRERASHPPPWVYFAVATSLRTGSFQFGRT